MVFLIGMRINRWRKVRTWWPVFVGMPKMLRELAGRPEVGLLGREQLLGRPRTSSPCSTGAAPSTSGRFARDPEMQHQPAWAAFNRAGAATGDVGIWHETYLVPAANIESLYGNMPEHGLGAALGSEPRGQHGRTSAQDEMGQRTRSTSRPDARARQPRFRDARRLGAWISSSSSWCIAAIVGAIVVAKKRSELARWRRRRPSWSR